MKLRYDSWIVVMLRRRRRRDWLGSSPKYTLLLQSVALVFNRVYDLLLPQRTDAFGPHLIYAKLLNLFHFLHSNFGSC